MNIKRRICVIFFVWTMLLVGKTLEADVGIPETK